MKKAAELIAKTKINLIIRKFTFSTPPGRRTMVIKALQSLIAAGVVDFEQNYIGP